MGDLLILTHAQAPCMNIRGIASPSPCISEFVKLLQGPPARLARGADDVWRPAYWLLKALDESSCSFSLSGLLSLPYDYYYEL